MDILCVDKCYFTSNTICCEWVINVKQYLKILQVETNRLSTLQHDCNQLLDTFYALKNEYDIYLKEILPIKYLANDDLLSSHEHIEEFTLYVKSVWQMGKHKFSENGKKIQYQSYVGRPLAEVVSTIQSFVEEVMVRLSYMPYHSQCAATIHSICSQIWTDLQQDCLGSADACLCQYVYLQAAIPYLQDLVGLVHRYLLLPDVYTPKQLVDKVILKIPSIINLTNRADTEDTQPFRHVVELLNGALLDQQVLDHNSDIKPIVEEDINLKRSVIVVKTVDWILQQQKSQDVLKFLDNYILPEKKWEFEKTKRCTRLSPSSLFSSSPRIFNPSSCREPINSIDPIESLDWSAMCGGTVSHGRNLNRRVRKTGPTNSGLDSLLDLQPIKLHTLHTPLLPPLL